MVYFPHEVLHQQTNERALGRLGEERPPLLRGGEDSRSVYGRQNLDDPGGCKKARAAKTPREEEMEPFGSLEGRKEGRLKRRNLSHAPSGNDI